MAYLVQCRGCGASAVAECTCPPEMAEVPAHVAGCPAADLDAQLDCDPDGDCCLQDHHHGEQANASGNPCRPVTITALPGAVPPLQRAGG